MSGKAPEGYRPIATAPQRGPKFWRSSMPSRKKKGPCRMSTVKAGKTRRKGSAGKSILSLAASMGAFERWIIKQSRRGSP